MAYNVVEVTKAGSGEEESRRVLQTCPGKDQARDAAQKEAAKHRGFRQAGHGWEATREDGRELLIYAEMA